MAHQRRASGSSGADRFFRILGAADDRAVDVGLTPLPGGNMVAQAVEYRQETGGQGNWGSGFIFFHL